MIKLAMMVLQEFEIMSDLCISGIIRMESGNERVFLNSNEFIGFVNNFILVSLYFGEYSINSDSIIRLEFNHIFN